MTASSPGLRQDVPETLDHESAIDPDSAFHALALLLAVHHVGVDPARLRHALGHSRPIGADDLVRIARRENGVRAKRVRIGADKLANQPFPALASGPEGWFMIGRVTHAGILIQRPGRPLEIVSAEDLARIWSGELVLVAVRPAESQIVRKFDMRWFVPQIVRYRRLIGEVLAITLALNLLGLASPLLFQNVIDKVLVHNTLSTLNVLAIAFVGVAVWEVMFSWLRTRLFSETSQKMDVELGARLMRHLLSLPLGYFETRRVGDTVTRVRQLETIREFMTNASLTVLVDPLFAIVFMGAMLIYSPMLTLIPLASIFGYAFVSLTVTPPLRARLDTKYERGAASNALLVESVSGIQTVKAAAVEPQWQNDWEGRLAAYSSASQRVTMIGATGAQAIELISKLSFAAILFFGARSVMAGALSVGGLVAFNMFAQRLAAPIVRMAQLFQEFQQVRLSVDRLGDILNASAEPSPRSRVAMPAIRGGIRLEGVSFRYGEAGQQVLNGIDLDIPAGSAIGIVGSSGSGKSTLTKLVQRLYVPTAGRVTVDGYDIAQVDPAWLRRQIGVVLQENLLFSRTVRENIALADPSMPLQRVIEAAQLAGAHDFIMDLPNGYDTEIVERGQNLSGGQRQRIAIARALVTDPRILILDEATSALDAESEEILRANIHAIARGRTMIIIAHRLSAVSKCDRIITLEKGRIVEQGTHDELVGIGGRYADLHRRQLGVRELAA